MSGKRGIGIIRTSDNQELESCYNDERVGKANQILGQCPSRSKPRHI